MQSILLHSDWSRRIQFLFFRRQPLFMAILRVDLHATTPFMGVTYNPCAIPQHRSCMTLPSTEVAYNSHPSPIPQGLCATPIQAPFYRELHATPMEVPSTGKCTQPPFNPFFQRGCMQPFGNTFQRQLYVTPFLCRSEHFMLFLAKMFLNLIPPHGVMV